MLIEESIGPVLFKNDVGCSVLSGNWIDPYRGLEITNATTLDIDHLVPRKEAHESGGLAWDTEKRRSYTNDLIDPDYLIAVCRGLDQQTIASDLHSGYYQIG